MTYDDGREGRGRSGRDRHRDHGQHRRGERGGGERRGGDGDFQEKRIIDTIVHLVTENVGRMIDDREGEARGRRDGGDEKRIVDLIVGLVSEHVEEIVRTELDRRLGPGTQSGDDRECGPSNGPEPRRSGGDGDREPL